VAIFLIQFCFFGFREVNEDNMIFRNVAAEGFEDGFKHVRIGIGFHYGVNLFLNIFAVNFFLYFVAGSSK
jgi:hypothetical protein